MKKAIFGIMAILLVFAMVSCSDGDTKTTLPPPAPNVFFIVDGQVYAEVYVAEDGKITRPADPTKLGFEFDEWVNPEDNTPWDFADDEVGEDGVVLMATWTKDANFTGVYYTITYYGLDGNGFYSYEVAAAPAGASVSITRIDAMAEAQEEGCTFVDWYKEEAFTNAFDFTADITGDADIYGKWNCTVTFNTQDGSLVDSAQVVNGGKATKPTTDPTKEGGKFAGWYKEAAGTTEWDFDTDVITGATTIYAKWTPVWVVWFNANGGGWTGQINTSALVDDGETVAAPTEDPIRSGYKFEGWYTENEDGNKWDFDNDTVTEDINLCAKWTADDEE